MQLTPHSARCHPYWALACASCRPVAPSWLPHGSLRAAEAQRTLRILLSAWPMCRSPFAYGGPSCSVNTCVTAALFSVTRVSLATWWSVPRGSRRRMQAGRQGGRHNIYATLRGQGGLSPRLGCPQLASRRSGCPPSTSVWRAPSPQRWHACRTWFR